MSGEEGAVLEELSIELLRSTILHLSTVIEDSQQILFRAKLHLQQAKSLVDDLEEVLSQRVISPEPVGDGRPSYTH